MDDAWLVVYRLMSKRVLCIPEIFVYFARLPHMVRSVRVDSIYRTHHIVNGVVKLRPITGGGHDTGKTITAVGVRFVYEMHDQFIF